MVTPTLAPDQLHAILDLYEQGLYVQAYTLGQELGPLPEWRGTDARLIAGRLAAQVGAPRLARRLHRRAWREDRDHLEACYYRARARLEHSGPLAAWEFLRRRGDLPEAPADLRGNWFALRGAVAAHLRDFDTADAWIARAREVAPHDPWIFVEQAEILELEDQYEEALAAARHSLALQPWFRPAVQATAHLLQLLSRDDEALALLTEAAGRIESVTILAMLTLVQTEQGRWADARESLDRLEALSPLMEKEVAQWLAGRRSDVAYYCGDREGAIRYARLADDPFHTAIAERLSAVSDRGAGANDTPNSQLPTPNSRVLLPVGFIRQHHMTCAPATLAALSRFWSMPADHLSVVEAICYDGTPDHSERHWAEQNGWMTREFTVTWESAVALLDRGIPFTLATSDATTGHLQAVIGYDAHRRTLLVRDPYMRHFGEALADEILSHLRSTGPRGMALVPREKAELLEALDLPDAPLYDRYHRLQRALQQHDRPEAQRIYDGLQETAPDHRLTLQARRSLATYDSDPTELLACAERMLELYPDDGNLQLLKLSCLRDLARRDDRLALLQDLCAKKETHPVLRQQYAQELAPDAREHPRAVRLLRRCIRLQPGEGVNLYLLARILWDQRRFEEALALFRFASCLEEKNEGVAQGYFFASRHMKQTEATIRFLHSRFRRFGARSSQPARTLFWALGEIDHTPKAFQVLEEALRLRPNDGELQLFAAQAHSRHGDFECADRYLAAADGKTQRSEWLRTAAEMALHRGDLNDALALRRQVVDAEPFDVDGQRMVAQLLAATQSQAAALAYLQGIVARFPHHYLLHQLWIEWLRDEPEEAPDAAPTNPGAQSKTQNPGAQGNPGRSKIETAVRHLIEINPVDAWARQELALLLGRQGRLEEAFAESETAGRLDPTGPGRWCVHGQVCSMAGKMEEARQAHRQAIQLSVDTDYAIWALVEACDTPAERREALAFIEGELVRQTTLGDGLLAFRERAQAVLAPGELLATLRRALRARPDLWHAWSAVIQQLTDMDQLDEADSLARQATARFPLLPRLWLDLAVVSRARGERAAELEALQHALRISPGWSPAIGQLASLYERNHEFDRAKTLLEQSVARSPLDPLCRGWLAQILWRLDQKEEALQQVERALELEPGYEWAWSALHRWSQEQDGGERAAAFGRRLAARRPGEARSWMMLARTLVGEPALPERLAAVDRAIALNPRNTDAYELKAEILTGAGRFEDALAACRPEVWSDEPPSDLRARAAWVEAERGNMRGAIAQMRALVADDPHDVRGWAELARWYDQGGAQAEYLEAAQQMARLEPLNPRSFAILADARLQTGDRRGAKEAFRRAFELAPEYAFAGMSLFDAQLEDRELQEAGQTLERLRSHIAGRVPAPEAWAVVLAREVQLQALRGDQDAATRAMRELCVTPTEETWPFYAAAGAIHQAGWNSALDSIFDEMLDRPDVNPHVGALWVRSRIAQNDWKCAARLEALRDRGAVGREATAAYLEVLAESNRVWLLQRFLKEHAGLLRRDTATWASAGYALETIGDVRRTALWLADWQSRPDAEPWMLIPLAVALRATGREQEAATVSRHALSLDSDARSACHAIWLAVDAALAGRHEEAANLLASFDPAEQSPYYRFLHTLAHAAVELEAAEPGARAAIFEGLRGPIQEATPPQADMTCPAMKRFHRRLLRRIAGEAGGFRAKLWLWAWFIRGARF